MKSFVGFLKKILKPQPKDPTWSGICQYCKKPDACFASLSYQGWYHKNCTRYALHGLDIDGFPLKKF